ncbi:MAG: IS1096 element passenger TnpR family protein [Gammaproteobacteria bacterium]
MRACPPEDCGGPPGYEHLLETLRDPKHEDHEQMREWIGSEFDPEAFDLGKVNQGLWRMQ